MTALSRSLFLAVLMALASAATSALRPAETRAVAAPDLDAMLPAPSMNG